MSDRGALPQHGKYDQDWPAPFLPGTHDTRTATRAHVPESAVSRAWLILGGAKLVALLLIALAVAACGLWLLSPAPAASHTLRSPEYVEFSPAAGTRCGSRGGPGYRLASGRCASWDDHRQGRR